ncbi:SH3 domain-containing protein [Pelagibacterium limicola]|uniref:SH3 domain-containing protein n=1 Tax=Pelagibacterium limicola TaxID=2791022 RepID=UPI001FECBC74|nr:SH3 domain-containing protein [Pelagibacterium limicola]
MALRKNMVRGGLAALMTLVMTVGAYAWTATATTSVNVRSGPGTNFRVIDVLQRGQQVEVEYCRGSWCFVDQGRYGPNGWVSANYLAQSHVPPRPPHWTPNPPPPPHWNPYPPRPPHWNPYPPRPPHWNPYPPRPPHWGHPRPPHNPGHGQVCFNGPNGYVCIGN